MACICLRVWVRRRVLIMGKDGRIPSSARRMREAQINTWGLVAVIWAWGSWGCYAGLLRKLVSSEERKKIYHFTFHLKYLLRSISVCCWCLFVCSFVERERERMGEGSGKEGRSQVDSSLSMEPHGGLDLTTPKIKRWKLNWATQAPLLLMLI